MLRSRYRKRILYMKTGEKKSRIKIGLRSEGTGELNKLIISEKPEGQQNGNMAKIIYLNFTMTRKIKRRIRIKLKKNKNLFKPGVLRNA